MEALCPLALVGVRTRGFSLGADGKAAALALLGEGFVEVAVHLLESGGVEAVGENGSPADNVLSGGQLFGVSLHHFGLDAVPDGFGLRLGLFDNGLPLVEGFDLGYQFILAHVQISFSFIGAFPLTDYILHRFLCNFNPQITQISV